MSKNYEYRNKNGVTFGITQTDGGFAAHMKGSYVAQAETDRELEEVLDHFSHSDINKTLDYTGIARENKTAD